MDTKHLFKEMLNRENAASESVKSLFSKRPKQAITYELTKQGLLLTGESTLQLDVWGIVEKELITLMEEWRGPDIPIYIFPITKGARKNGVAYPQGICLFVSQELTAVELSALFLHEYHHICRRGWREPLTLCDSLLMEGLAEHAVAYYYEEEYVSSWTTSYTMEQVRDFWATHFLPNRYLQGVGQHYPFLYGDPKKGLPPWIGYCLGYRIVQAFIAQNEEFSPKQLLTMETEDLLLGAGFK